ncbi:hypothetical protein JW926_06620, partial [Candidatus Sumerlaeota bacterium]|nr:hypothetical protein [Candidatus Sumerlaeota bacterium]
MRFFWRVFFLFLFLYLLTMGGHIYSPDEEILFRVTQSLAEHGRLSIEPLLGFATKQGIDGKQYAQYGVGQPLLAVPFYYFGKLLAAVFPGGNDPFFIKGIIQYHDGSMNSVQLRLGVSIFNQVVTSLLCAMLFLFCYRLTGDKTASWMTVLLFGMGSYALPHSKPFFMEPLSALLCFSSFFLFYLGLSGQSLKRTLLAGCLFAYSLLVRLDNIFMLPGYAVLIFFHNARESEPGLLNWIRSQSKPVQNKGKENDDAIEPGESDVTFSPLH